MENLILTSLNGGIATITINRPNQLNALNRDTIEQLHQELMALRVNEEVRVVVLTGSGEKAFVAGADIKEFAHYTQAEGKELAARGQNQLFDLVENFPKPVIAAVNGFALGGGLELAMSCHFRYASINAKMGLPEVSLGVIPGYGGTQRLPRLVGKGRAMEMIMSAQMIDAATALSYGLVNQVVEQADLLEACYATAQRILRNSSNAIAEAIGAVNAAYNNQVNGFQEEIDAFGRCFQTPEFVEGTTAFMEKRKANFS